VNIVDENVPDEECALLEKWRLRVQKIGKGVGRGAMGDDDIIPLLHNLDRPTFFTLDAEFYKRRLRHGGYCLVFLDVSDDLVAEYVRRILRHPSLNTKAKRMGLIIRAEPAGITLWRVHGKRLEQMSWE
jgi:hypothetical protein